MKNWDKADAGACVHAIVEPGGDVYQLLPWDYRGWHCRLLLLPFFLPQLRQNPFQLLRHRQPNPGRILQNRNPLIGQ